MPVTTPAGAANQQLENFFRRLGEPADLTDGSKTDSIGMELFQFRIEVLGE